MAAYLIANITVTDRYGFERYRANVPAVIAAHGGRYIVRGGATEVVEGDLDINRLIILEFPDMAALKRFYASPEYEPLLALRRSSTRSDVVFTEGLRPA